jgi:NAD(P)-dependent dehydrogenase (short-subunit alcohol dehydrogenase family)
MQVSTGELAEVMAINAIAPAILNARLKTLMQASPARFKFIVNVSAMEGKFYRWKSENHPHTNMAKAAL